MKDTTGETQQGKIIRYSMMPPGEKERLDRKASRKTCSWKTWSRKRT